ncbi:MAG: alpha/beta fold hydrolase [Deltaproteobacteria bacterium]
MPRRRIHAGGAAPARRPALRAALSCILLGLLAASGTGCSHAARNSRHEVYERARYGLDRFATPGGLNVHYVEAGAGPPVLLIPGAFTTYRTWDRIMPLLAGRHRVIAIDYVGVGDSDKPSEGFGYSAAEQADVVAEMIRGLGLGRVNVMSASYGSLIALNLAARYPGLVDGVVCIEGGVLVDPKVLKYSRLGGVLGWPVIGDVVLAFMKTGFFDRMTARSVMGSAWERLGPAERDEVTRVFSANIRTASRASWYGIYRSITTPVDYTGFAGRLRAPVLYLYGGESRYLGNARLNVDFFRSRLPAVKVLLMERGVHDLQLQYPGEIVRLASEFWQARPGGTAVAGYDSDPEPAGPGPEGVAVQ